MYHHVLTASVLGDSKFVFIRKYGISGNNNLVLNIRDNSMNVVTNTQFNVLVTYLDYTA